MGKVPSDVAGRPARRRPRPRAEAPPPQAGRGEEVDRPRPPRRRSISGGATSCTGSGSSAWRGARRSAAYGKSGTFHELWQLAWRPEFVVDLIAASRYGTTVAAAAAAKATEEAAETDRLPVLTGLIEAVLLSDLPDAVEAVVARIGAVAAVAADVPSLMEALPPLARVVRYGNVRGTDAEAVRAVVDGFIARICVGVAAACASLDDDAAREMLPRIDGTDAAVSLIDDADHRAVVAGGGSRPGRTSPDCTG